MLVSFSLFQTARQAGEGEKKKNTTIQKKTERHRPAHGGDCARAAHGKHGRPGVGGTWQALRRTAPVRRLRSRPVTLARRSLLWTTNPSAAPGTPRHGACRPARGPGRRVEKKSRRNSCGRFTPHAHASGCPCVCPCVSCLSLSSSQGTVGGDVPPSVSPMRAARRDPARDQPSSPAHGWGASRAWGLRRPCSFPSAGRSKPPTPSPSPRCALLPSP